MIPGKMDKGRRGVNLMSERSCSSADAGKKMAILFQF
jgi:hypothetical protein